MKEKTPEELQRIVDKWKHVLEGPRKPLSACKVMLIESQERIYTKEEVEAATLKQYI